MNGFLLVALGSAVGGVLRYGIALLGSPDGSLFPVRTLAVNLLGGLLIGLGAGLLDPVDQQGARLLLLTGFCGGFTTFSAFSYETVGLIAAGEWSAALLYVLASILFSVGACALGYWLIR